MHPQKLLFSDIIKQNKERTHSLYIGLNLHGEKISELAIEGGENPKDYHVTLLWGKFTPRSDIDDTVCRVQNVMKEIQSDIPESVTLFYHERRFEASESSDGKDVIVAPVAGDVLHQVHKKLLEELKNEGITVEKTFDEYIPHMTLAYIDPNEEYELRALDHSVAAKDVTVCIKNLATREKEYKRDYELKNIAKSFSDMVRKYNDNHDPATGRFAPKGGGGYHGRSMSNRAVRAYESGEKPLSKWDKKSIVEEINNFAFENDIDISDIGLEKLSTEELRDNFLERTSWHHTGALYNKTDFYSVTDKKLSDLSKDKISEIISNRKPRKTKTEEEKKEDKKKKDILAESKNAYDKLEMIYAADTMGVKKLSSVFDRWNKGKIDLEEEYKKAIDKLKAQEEKRVEQWRKLPEGHWRHKTVELFDTNFEEYARQTFGDKSKSTKLLNSIKEKIGKQDGVAKTFSELAKFNPYHDRLGRFSAANGAASFTYKPGASTAHDNAIAREKAKAASETASEKGFKGTLYHGSPNTDIKEFDMKRAGQNTSSGEKLLFFTDSKQMADDFSYERLEGSSKFFQVRGKKGRVYEVDVEMKNPLDFRKLSDKDMDNMIKLDVDGILTKETIKNLSGKNHQLLKASLELTSESLKELGYDGLIANTGKAGHNSLEYAVVDSKQAVIKKSSETGKLMNGRLEKSSFNIYKADEDKRLVFGWALVSAKTDGQKIIDLQGDIVDQEDLEEGAYEYVLNFRDAGEEHIGSLRKKARMVESVVFTEEKMQAMGIPPGTVPIGWWIGFYVDDDRTWELIKNGTYKMFSIEGKAVREPIKEPLTKGIAKSFSELAKFNPYHDRLGRFTGAGTATSFTYKPGQGAMYDNAIAREKQRHAQETAGTPPKLKAARPKEATPRIKGIQKVENKIRNQNFESAAVIDKDGNELFFKDGQRSFVSFTPNESMQMRGNTLTHNHPRCSMFSVEDLQVLIKNDMYEMRATNRDGTTYSMKRAEDGSFNKQRALDYLNDYAVNYHHATVHAQHELDRRGIDRKIMSGEMTHDEANIEFGRVSAKYIADYVQKTAAKKGLIFTIEQTSVSKSLWREIMYADVEKADDEIVLDRETNDMLDQAFNEWLEKHGLTGNKEVAKSFSDIMKFNPYHDSRGRFATSSGYASFTVRTKDPAKQHMADMAIQREKDRNASSQQAQAPKDGFTPAKTRDEAVEYAKSKLGMKNVDYGSLEVETINHINHEITKVYDKYPDLKDFTDNIKIDNGKNVYAAMGVGLDSKASFYIGRHKFGKGLESVEQDYQKDVQSGFHPAGTDSNSVIWYEFGHALAYSKAKTALGFNTSESLGFYDRNDYFKNVKNRTFEKDAIRGAAKELKITQKELKSRISRYAEKNPAETFAEAFAEFNCSKNPRPECVAIMKAAGLFE